MLSHRTKILIDRIFGSFAIVLFKYPTRLMGLLLRIDHSVATAPKTVAVAKIVGLGSVVYTGILCRALKEKFPSTKLIYITSGSCAELAQRMRYIDEILVIDEKNAVTLISSTVALIFKLWKRRPELYFDMEVYSGWASIIATLSLARNRYGFYRKNSEFKKGIHTHTIFFNTRRHISEIYEQMAALSGCKPRPELDGLLFITDDDRKKCRLSLEKSGIVGKSFALVNPNASDLLIERRWPLDRWVKYLEKASFEFPRIAFLIIGTRNERNYVTALCGILSEKAQKHVINTAGEFSLGPLLALIEQCMLVITNDSGPLHFAAALGKPTVSIWGPGDPEHYAPLKGTHKIVYQPVYCSPCLYHADFPPCSGDNICVKEISVDTVFKQTKEIMDTIKEDL